MPWDRTWIDCSIGSDAPADELLKHQVAVELQIPVVTSSQKLPVVNHRCRLITGTQLSLLLKSHQMHIFTHCASERAIHEKILQPSSKSRDH